MTAVLTLLCCQEDPVKAPISSRIYNLLNFEVTASEIFPSPLLASPPLFPPASQFIAYLWNHSALRRMMYLGTQMFLCPSLEPSAPRLDQSPFWRTSSKSKSKSQAWWHYPCMKGLCEGSQWMMIKFPSSQNILWNSKEIHHLLARARTRFSEV